jgi:hypothetical protein
MQLGRQFRLPETPVIIFTTFVVGLYFGPDVELEIFVSWPS